MIEFIVDVSDGLVVAEECLDDGVEACLRRAEADDQGQYVIREVVQGELGNIQSIQTRY